MPDRDDFSGNVKIYDRRHGSAISDQLAQIVTSRLAPGSTIIDVGAGTGRVAIPLSRAGSQVVAAEPAISMLHALQRKSGGATVLGVAADGTRLPLRRRSADAVVMTRLLYLVSEWQDLLREAKGVLKQGGCLFHEWGNGDGGEDWVRIRERARSLFQEAGVASPFHPGARTEDSIDSYLRKIGFRQKERIDGGVGPTMTLGNFLDKIQSGEFPTFGTSPRMFKMLASHN